MSKRRGLSADEKREKLRELFVETKDVYTLKELEKLAPKAKGIIAMAVKDVLQQLVDENMVKQDKIGTGNYFWLFPSDEINNRTQRAAKLKTDYETLKRKKSDLQKEKEESQVGREESEERSAKLQKLSELEKENQQLRSELAQFADSNPELIEAMKKDITVAKEAANRWTDNIWTVKSYCVNKWGLDGSTFNQNFGIPENFDYVE